MLEGTPTARQLAAVAVLACAVRCFAAAAIPFATGGGDPNFAPDESAHFLVARDLAFARAPVWPASSSVYSVFPPTQYAAQAATLMLARAFIREPGIFWARLGSVLLGVGGVLLLARSAGRFSRDARSGVLAGAAAALYPQFAFVTSYCNADAFTIFAGLLLVDALAAWSARGESGAGLAYVGAAAGLVLTAKVNGFYLLVPAAAWVLSRRPSLRDSIRSIAIAALVAAPFLLWNAARTAGDPLGVRLYAKFMAEVWRPQTLFQIPHGLWEFFRLAASSAIGVFGNMSLPLPAPLRFAIAALLAFGTAAAVRWPPSRAATFLAAAAALNLLSELAKCALVDFQPQGRYLLVPALLLTCVAVLAPARRWPPWAFAALAVLAVSTATMEWQLATRGR